MELRKVSDPRSAQEDTRPVRWIAESHVVRLQHSTASGAHAQSVCCTLATFSARDALPVLHNTLSLHEFRTCPVASYAGTRPAPPCALEVSDTR